MPFTPQTVHERATPDANEVLVSGVNADGIATNVLLRDAAALRGELLATPVTIPNPARPAVEAKAFAAAVAQVDAAEREAERAEEERTDHDAQPAASPGS